MVNYLIETGPMLQSAFSFCTDHSQNMKDSAVYIYSPSSHLIAAPHFPFQASLFLCAVFLGLPINAS